jgi:AcrR family transcriptional regulator
MPKIIEHLRETLLAEARKQVETHGFAATTIRSVAAACNVGVGTVYNYFPSKELLVAAYMLEDWQTCMNDIRAALAGAPDAASTLGCIYRGLTEFNEAHRSLFADRDATVVFASAGSDKHPLLRRQIADLLLPLTADLPGDRAFLGEFIAEALITWSTEGRPFHDVFPIIQKLLQ